jgi:hypothetical protein
MGEKLRYIEYLYKKDNRTHHLIEIRSSDLLQFLLYEAKKGRTIQELIELLVRKNIPFERAHDYIDKLIDNQILISELDPTITGDEFLIRLLRILSPIDHIEEIKNTLRQGKNKLDVIDCKLGNSPDQYINIAGDLRQLGVEYNLKYLFQTDMSLNLIKFSISKSTQDSIKAGLLLFNKLTTKFSNTNIIQFIEAFTKHYETRECPLLNALDTETGIGYLQTNRNSDGDISPLIDDVAIPSKDNNLHKVEWNNIQNFLFNKILGAKGKNSYEIEFTDDEIKLFTSNWSDLPSTFYCIIKIVEASTEKYPGGRILIEGVGGSSASQILGRFCHGNIEILDFVKEIAVFEKSFYSDAIIAEIVHLPESRTGNVILRPYIT